MTASSGARWFLSNDGRRLAAAVLISVVGTGLLLQQSPISTLASGPTGGGSLSFVQPPSAVHALALRSDPTFRTYAATMDVTPRSVTPGGSVTVSWTGFSPSGNDWISMHPAGTANPTVGNTVISWKPLNSASTSDSGSLVFTAPKQPGSYMFWLLRNGAPDSSSPSFQVLAPTSAPTPAPTATLTPVPTPTLVPIVTKPANWAAGGAIDGRVDTGWESADGSVSNQWLRLAFHKTYTINRVVIDPAATGGDTPDADLKDFAVRVSTDGKTFTNALTGQTQQTNAMQSFDLPTPVQASQVELDAVSNYGSSHHVAVAEIAVYGRDGASQSFHRDFRIEAKSSALGQVRYIRRGLSVQPPKHKPANGKVHQKVYTRYFLRTGSQQAASLNFSDGTVLHMNQRTDAVLQSPNVTQVKRGEVLQDVQPGTDHQVQTASAVASAIGTIFDVAVRKKVTSVTVVEGAVLVQNDKGSVVVKTGEGTTVVKGTAPTTPVPVDTSRVTAWAKGISTPDLGHNVALDANGGIVAGSSS